MLIYPHSFQTIIPPSPQKKVFSNNLGFKSTRPRGYSSTHLTVQKLGWKGPVKQKTWELGGLAWWFRILGVPPSNNPFHTGRIQESKPNQQLTTTLPSHNHGSGKWVYLQY